MSAHRTAAAAMTLVVGAAVLAPWLLDALSAGAAASLSLVSGCVLTLGFLRAGWCGGRRIVRLSWTADGRWLFALANGRSLELLLDPGARATAHVLWLRWRSESAAFPGRTLLLSPLDVPREDLRRLVSRLRLDGAAAALQAAPAVVAV